MTHESPALSQPSVTHSNTSWHIVPCIKKARCPSSQVPRAPATSPPQDKLLSMCMQHAQQSAQLRSAILSCRLPLGRHMRGANTDDTGWGAAARTVQPAAPPPPGRRLPINLRNINTVRLLVRLVRRLPHSEPSQPGPSTDCTALWYCQTKISRTASPQCLGSTRLLTQLLNNFRVRTALAAGCQKLTNHATMPAHASPPQHSSNAPRTPTSHTHTWLPGPAS
jgi:hypothetical protein